MVSEAGAQGGIYIYHLVHISDVIQCSIQPV